MKILYNILEFLLLKLPDYSGTFPEWGSFATLKGYAFMFDSFLPVTLIFTFLGIMLSIELVYFGYRLALRIYSAIRKN